MLPPVACSNCGRQITLDHIRGFIEEKNKTRKKKGDIIHNISNFIQYEETVSYSDYLNKVGLDRECCRCELITFVDLSDKIS